MFYLFHLQDGDSALRIFFVTAIDAPSQTESDQTMCSVLLVEDNKINQKVALLMLARLGIVPDIAENGQEALDCVEKKNFDLILMDLHMPGMDGIETTRHIRSMLGETCPPIVALTADGLRQTQLQSGELGLDGFLSKPISAEQLRECVNTYTPFRL